MAKKTPATNQNSSSRKGAAIAARAASVPLDSLFVAVENARFGRPPENVDELAANIAAYGLLQPLLAYEGDSSDGKQIYAVVGGARRLAALLLLRGHGAVPIDGRFSFDAIPLRLIDPADAAASSLAENTQRVDLGVVDAALAWNRMTLDGREIGEIAKAFGVTERFVKGRIRLAALHEPILEALRTGDISLDVAQLYAGAHTTRQERVWKALGPKQNRTDYQVREALKKNTLRAGDSLARFVGEEAYVAAGGQVEHELFTRPEDGRWLNPEIAERLGAEKLKAAAAELEGEGFLFVEPALEAPRDKYVDGNLGKPRKASAEEKQRVSEIGQREKALAAERKQIHAAADKRDPDGWGDELTPEEEGRVAAIDAEADDLRAERVRIEAGQVVFDEKAKAKSGAIVSIDATGALVVRRGLVAPRERKATLAGKGAAPGSTRGKAASAKPSKPEPQAPMTNLTHEKTSRVASAVVGRTLARAPSVALVAITAALARAVFCDRPVGEEVLDIPFRAAFEPAVDLLSDEDLAQAAKRWQVALGKDFATLEARMIDWPQNDVLDLLALCVGAYVKVIEPNAAREYGKHDARTRLGLLGRLAGANPAAHFIPDAEYLNGFSRPSLDAAAAELGLDTAGTKTKTALAAMIADKAKGAGATAAWVPPLLRTLCGMEEPAKKAAVGKKLGPPARHSGASRSEEPGTLPASTTGSKAKRAGKASAKPMKAAAKKVRVKTLAKPRASREARS